MLLSNIDWIIIIFFLLLFLVIGLKFRKQAGNSLSDFFLGGRKLPWYIAGVSMVATTFAADTPLAVTEIVAMNGISGNWLWWNMLIGGMLTVFFFSGLWRRSGVLTELEFIELRYEGKSAAFLRGFKSIYLGLLMNAIIIGWVNLAMMSLLEIFFDIPKNQQLYYVGGLMLLAVIYSGMSGLKGVVFTDFIQFIIAMVGCIVLAVIVVCSEKIGGIGGLKEKLPEYTLDFFPQVGVSDVSEPSQILTLTLGVFLSFLGVQWWASWYPGAEPGGGGYIVQRMLSTKDEKNAVFATLFFQIAHYCIRPWPWILVALCAIVLYPDLPLEESKSGFVLAMKDFLPDGLRGLLLVAFISAYLSTISTQVNWGASYITNDLIKRFLLKKEDKKNEKQLVSWGRLATILIMIISLFVTSKLDTIKGAWEFIIECGAGLGLVLILRWYWWRINAWSEITATFIPFIAYSISKFILEPEWGTVYISNRGTLYFTVGVTTVSWLVVTYFTSPVSQKKLLAFYNKVKPGGFWAKVVGITEQAEEKKHLLYLVICWGSSIVMTYSVLIGIGKLLFGFWNEGFIAVSIAIFSLLILKINISKIRLFD